MKNDREYGTINSDQKSSMCNNNDHACAGTALEEYDSWAAQSWSRTVLAGGIAKYWSWDS